MIAFDHIALIGVFKQIDEIAALFLLGFPGDDERQAAVHGILRKAADLVAVIRRH